MGRTLSNQFSLQYAIQSAFDNFTTAAGDWKLVEPNEVSSFGPTITTRARQPISKIRGARKGSVTDLDAAIEFVSDLTLDSFTDFVGGFCLSTPVNGDLTFLPSAVVAASDAYTVPALSASQAARLRFSAAQYATLVYARGFALTENNGLNALSADPVTTDTAIPVTAVLTNETTTAVQNATVELAGLRSLAAAADFTWDWDAGTGRATLTSAADIADFSLFGLSVGQYVHIGSPDGSGGVQNAFQNAVANDMFGYARVYAISTNTIVFDQVDAALMFDDASAPATAVDVLFGTFVRPVQVDHADYEERIFLWEGSWPNLFVESSPGDPDGFEYVVNSYCNRLTWSLPLTELSTATFAFVATDGEPPVNNASRRTGADAPLVPVRTGALNTSSDITRIRIVDVDEAGLTTDFKDTTFNVDNGVTPEKVLGVLGARYINIGNLAVTLESTILFTNGDAIAAIRNNTTVSMQQIVSNDDGGIVMDLPSMTLGGGARELPVNESVRASLTGAAFIDARLGYVVGFSVFPVVP